MAKTNNIFESNTSQEDTFDEGYLAALDKILDVLESGDDGGDDGSTDGGGSPFFPDPRLVMPRKKGGKQEKQNNGNSPKPQNKSIDIDTGEEFDSNQNENNKSSQEQAQDAADSAQNAAMQAQDAANKAKEQANGENSDKAQKAVDKAQKAADKAQKAAEKAQKAADKGDTKGAKEAANEAKDAANEAKIAANEMQHSNEVDKMSAEDSVLDARNSANTARQAAEEARQFANSMEASSDETIKNIAKKAAEKAEKAASQAEKAADKAEKAAEKYSKDASQDALEKVKEAAKEAREAADVANAAKNSAQRANELNQENEENDDYSGGKMSERDKFAAPEEIRGDLYDCSEYVEKVTKQFSSKLTGPIGEFLDKSRESIKDIKRIKNKEKKVAVKTYARKAKNAWDVDFKQIIDKYVSDCIQEKKREMRSTYMRPNRRQGQVQAGDVIKKGRIPKKDKMDITMTFYIDISGSMYGGPVINAFKAAYAFSDFIKKKNQDEAIIGDFDYTYYAFNTKFYKITDRKIPTADGDNVDFNEILEYIETHSINDMINVIITDAQFNIGAQKCIECIKRTDGLFIVIANNDKNAPEFERIKAALKEKFEFLKADESFTFKEPK